jgi:hypothetical protein
MGWLYTSGITRSELIARRTKPWENQGLSARCLEHTCVGNVLWTVWEHTKDGKAERFIGCDLLAGHNGSGWGYKDMEESMGPCYYSCPLKYLDLVPEPDSPYAKEWRTKVREYHARRARARALKVGETVALVGCRIPEVTITSIRPLRGTYGGRLYRIPATCLG